jgi:gliding motility-associated-like protein
MNRNIRNITTVFLSIVVWTCLSESLFAQTGCKVENAAEPVKGEFSINVNKVSVRGDGGRSLTAANNIPIKICEGEVINLKNTLPVSSSTSNTYWIIEEGPHWSNTAPIQSLSPVGSYSNMSGNFSVKLIDKASDASGFSLYNGPGRYVVIQYDNTVPLTGGGNNSHYSCQVIEVIKPEVPVVTTSVCSGNEVQITFAADSKNKFDDYEITFNATSGNFNPIFNTGKPTTYPFTVKSGTLLPDFQDRILSIKGVSITGNCNAPTTPNTLISFNAATIFKPVVSSVVGTSKKGEFKLAVSAQNNVSRNLYIRDPLLTNTYDYTNVFKKYGSTATATDSTVLQVPDGNKAYCFRAEALDLVCPSTTNNPSLTSNEEICTTPATVTAESNKNVITWLKAIGSVTGGAFSYYQVERLNANGTVDKLFPIINNPTELKVEDSGITCGQEYTYRVLTNYSQKSYSQIIKVRAVSDDIPSKIPRFFATMTNDAKYASVQGQFDPTNVPVNIKANNYKFYRADAINSTYSLIKIGNQLINDSTTEVDKKSYCYFMTWTNLCDKESSPSEKVCTVHLKSSGATVNWTKETSISAGTDSYIVQRVNPTNGTNIKELASNLINVNTYNTQVLPETEGQEIYIQIESRPVGWNIIGSNSLPSTLSNIVRIFRPSLMISPQIFTPNGDNNNDIFIVRGKFIKKLKMSIYDRWGNVIYYNEMDGYPTENNQNESTVVGWDGVMNNGNKALEGTYAFKIEVEDTIGQISVKEGALLLAY